MRAKTNGLGFFQKTRVAILVAVTLFSSAHAQTPINSTKSLFDNLPPWNGVGERPKDGKHVYRDPVTSELLIFVPALATEKRPDKVYRYRPPNQVAPIITNGIIREGSAYVYSYRIRNGSDARISIGMWGIVGPGLDSELQLPHPKWRSGRSQHTIVKGRFTVFPNTGEFLSWFADTGDRVAPNAEEPVAFRIRSSARPGIATAYSGAVSALAVESGLPGEVAAELTPFMNWDAETVIVPTIGPRYGPDLTSRVIADDYLVGMQELVSAGWLSNQSRFFRAIAKLLQQCSRSESTPCLTPALVDSLPVSDSDFERELARAVLMSLR